MPTEPKHRYAMAELLGETPEGWDRIDNDYYKITNSGQIHVYSFGLGKIGEAWFIELIAKSITDLAAEDLYHALDALSTTSSPYEAMAHTDDLLDEARQ